MLLQLKTSNSIAALVLFVVAPSFVFGANPLKSHPKSPDQLRLEYIARLQEQYVPANDEHTVGSLWTAQSSLGDFSTDYKAHHLNDTITIQVAVQTTAAQSGTVDSERSFTTSSAVTGIMGRV